MRRLPSEVGEIITVNEGGVAFGAHDLRMFLEAQDPRSTRVDGRDMTIVDEAGTRVRWMPAAATETQRLLGHPPANVEQTVAHTIKHEEELRRLAAHGIAVPTHSVWVVGNDPYFKRPTVYTAVSNIPGNCLAPKRRDLRTTDPARQRKLAALGLSLADFYSEVPAGDVVLHDDNAWAKQYNDDANPVLYDLEPRLDVNRGLGLDVIRNWTRWMRSSPYKEQLRSHLREIGRRQRSGARAGKIALQH